MKLLHTYTFVHEFKVIIYMIIQDLMYIHIFNSYYIWNATPTLFSLNCSPIVVHIVL